MSRNDMLVTAHWAQRHPGQPGIVLVEVDEDTSAYDKGHEVSRRGAFIDRR